MISRLSMLSAIIALTVSCGGLSDSSSVTSDAPLKYDLRDQDINQNLFDASGPNYLAVGINFAPIENLRQQIDRNEATSLQHRGEAHITIVTPPEYKTLSTHLSDSEIRSVLQEALTIDFSTVCLGRGDKQENHIKLSTFFVVIKSDDIFELRTALANQFQKKGGTSAAFDAQTYHPHITVGFTDRDLHLHDGVVKDERSCVAPFIR
jgi:2'-5' RNA ligase